MSQPIQLYNLQQIDTKLDKTHARLKEIEIALSEDAVLINAQQEATTAEGNYQTAQKELKRAEDEVQSQQQKIKNNQKTLYSGRVKNPKELEDLQNEAEALKRYLSVLEDRQLEKMIAFEEADAAYKASQTNLAEVEEQVAQQNIDLTKEQKELLEFINKLESKREQAVAGIESEEMATYTQLREARHGIAVTEVKDKTCNACGAALTASQAQAARSPSKITRCESCGRILYVK